MGIIRPYGSSNRTPAVSAKSLPPYRSCAPLAAAAVTTIHDWKIVWPHLLFDVSDPIRTKVNTEIYRFQYHI